MNFANPEKKTGDMFFIEGFSLFVNRAYEHFELPVHQHDFIEISYVWEGSGFHYIGEDVIRVQKGDLFFIPIGVPHIFRPSAQHAKNKLIIGNCLIDKKMFDYVVNDLTAALGLYQFQLFSKSTSDFLHERERNNEIERLFEQLHQEFREMRSGYQTVLCGLLLQLLIAFERLIIEKSKPVAEQPLSMQRIESYVKKQLAEKISLQDLASYANMTTRQLQRIVRKYKDMTVIEYIQHERINKACQLLSSEQYAGHTILDIASKVGIQDVKRFYKLFKSKTSMTPTQYRQKQLALQKNSPT